MAIVLKKGQKIDLTKGNPGLKKIKLGLGWDTNSFDSGHDYDLDVSVFMVGKSNRVERDEDFIFYNNLKHSSGSVEHLGDNRTGEGDGDDEEIVMDLPKIPEHIDKVAVTVTIYDAEQRRQNFGQVSNSYVRVINNEDDEEILRYDLGEEFSIETAITVCEIYRYNGEWKFSAVGAGFEGGLEALCRNYGLSV
ncbi:TerD family protein [Metaclostridioides mangenotii]|jgi:tellurium resistance protein TerD|uniref:Tellurium resistance protein TerD n=1 Tax=Metaclostridioides mangenotii TaxID=1540 RepID=A0ABS4E8K5_9FIRM|nr:TerD family protein [Clostridioides mangenotii]MBP1854275.1 tellurium resistance protein TerD [Clostridioides mangenotii]